MAGADVLPERAPVQGELVQVRSRRWLVEGVETTDDGRCTVQLACADDDAQGEELAVLWDYEIDRQILDDERWDDLAARGFDDPRYFTAFLNTLRWNTVTATDANLFQSPFRAGITIDAYQMEPLRKALPMCATALRRRAPRRWCCLLRAVGSPIPDGRQGVAADRLEEEAGPESRSGQPVECVADERMDLGADERRIADAFLGSTGQCAQLGLGGRRVATEVLDRGSRHRGADVMRQKPLEPGRDDIRGDGL